jgi:hypothetical protein
MSRGAHSFNFTLILVFLLGVAIPASAQDSAPGAGTADSLQIAPPSAPQGLAVTDVPNDSGEALELSWQPATGEGITGYLIRRGGSAEGPFTEVDTVGSEVTSFTDSNGPESSLRGGQTYYYQVVALGAGGEAASSVVSGVARQSFFNTERTNLFVLILLFFVLVLGFTRQAVRHARRGSIPFVRKIAGLTAIEEAIGRATEMGRAVLYVPGIDDANNIQTIYSMIILGNVAKTVARYETPLIVPICRAFVVPLAEETVKQGYVDAGRPDAYNVNNIRYLSEEQFAFTAGVDGIMLREKPAANLFLGSFFAESLILAETGFQTGAVQIAGTANIHQLPFFVVACDYTLIGEEFYAASAYLSREPKLIGVLKGTDWMKVIIIALIFIGVVASSAGWEEFRQWFLLR